MSRVCVLVAVVSVGVSLVGEVAAENWTQWRGPHGQGNAATTGTPTEWSETKNIAWKTAIPGQGWSSPLIYGDKIWLTTSTHIESSPADRKERMKSITNSQPVLVADKIEMKAVCLDKKTGELLQSFLLLTEEKPDPIHVQNTYATPTPVIEETRLYCHFGTHGTACLDTQTGKLIWANQNVRLNHENGPGGSPLIWQDKLIFHCDGSDVQYLAALDKDTGEVAWRTDRSGELNSNPQLKKAYCTPLIIRVAGADQLVSPGADWVYGYDPATGKELWRIAYGKLGFSNASRPVFGNGMLYLCTGYMKSRLLAIKFDVSAPHDPKVVWTFEKQVSEVPSPILVNNRLFFVGDDGGVVTCLDATSGEMVFQKRLGGNYWASPMYADGRIYFPSRDGSTSVIRADDKFELLAKNELDGTLMASPAAVDGSLFLRTDKALYRIEN